jgi:HK97 family phage prohead protease/HK97 family phage major capsid protein
MHKVFKLYSAIQKVQDVDDDHVKISGYASTVDTDRVGDIILPEAWTKGGLENYKKNPIILFNHNYSNPIGRTTDLEVDERGLKISSVISKSAGNTHGLIKDGVLTTFSVGFMIKDADYNKTNDGYIIKDAELLEVSVVTVPCNQDATFSLAKSFKNAEEYKKFVQEELEITPGQVDEVIATEPSPKDGLEPSGKKKMDEVEIQALVDAATKKALETERKRLEDEAKAKAEREAQEKRMEEAATKAAEAASKSTEEKLLEQVGETVNKAVKESSDKHEAELKELREALEERSEEIKSMRQRKIEFGDRKGDAGSAIKANMAEAEDAFILARVLKKKIDETEFGKSVMEKVNAHSTVTVGSDALETTVGTNIEREIWNDLILAPLFREVRMNSATQTFQIMPDAGYAEITANTTASGTQPNGNMDRRGAPYGAPYEGITLSDVELRTVKMIAKSYLGNETEEDAIIPILPLIREAMARSHQRGVENMLLAGNDVDGNYTSGAANGLIKIARTGGRLVTSDASDTTLTAAGLLSLRRTMGKYGLRPDDVVYIVSQHAYFDLMEDAEFQDADLVGNQATKLTGQVGLLYGSRVMICDEFAAPAAGKVFALALNRRNFVVPRLRGMTVESEYQVEQQRQVLVSSQRLGFAEIIPDATSVVALRYGA